MFGWVNPLNKHQSQSLARNDRNYTNNRLIIANINYFCIIPRRKTKGPFRNLPGVNWVNCSTFNYVLCQREGPLQHQSCRLRLEGLCGGNKTLSDVLLWTKIYALSTWTCHWEGLRSRWRLSSCYQLLYHVNEIWRSVDVPAIAFRIPAPFRGVSTQLAAQTSREIPGATCLCRWWVQGLFPGVRSGEYFSDVLFIRVGDSLCLDSGRVMLHGAEGGRAALLAVA